MDSRMSDRQDNEVHDIRHFRAGAVRKVTGTGGDGVKSFNFTFDPYPEGWNQRAIEPDDSWFEGFHRLQRMSLRRRSGCVGIDRIYATRALRYSAAR